MCAFVAYALQISGKIFGIYCPNSFDTINIFINFLFDTPEPETRFKLK